MDDDKFSERNGKGRAIFGCGLRERETVTDCDRCSPRPARSVHSRGAARCRALGCRKQNNAPCDIGRATAPGSGLGWPRPPMPDRGEPRHPIATIRFMCPPVSICAVCQKFKNKPKPKKTTTLTASGARPFPDAGLLPHLPSVSGPAQSHRHCPISRSHRHAHRIAPVTQPVTQGSRRAASLLRATTWTPPLARQPAHLLDRRRRYLR